jgi:hypothetical protein
MADWQKLIREKYKIKDKKPEKTTFKDVQDYGKTKMLDQLLKKKYKTTSDSARVEELLDMPYDPISGYIKDRKKKPSISIEQKSSAEQNILNKMTNAKNKIEEYGYGLTKDGQLTLPKRPNRNDYGSDVEFENDMKKYLKTTTGETRKDIEQLQKYYITNNNTLKGLRKGDVKLQDLSNEELLEKLKK